MLYQFSMPPVLFVFLCALSALVEFAVADPLVTIRGRQIDDWTYVLQGKNGHPLSLAPIATSLYDLAVIDYSSDGGADGEFTAAQISALQQSKDGKVVLAYLSIGEAETYRWYWQKGWTTAKGKLTASAPAWLAPQDPQWPGNFKVRYWDPSWQQIIFGVADGSQKSSLDRVIDAGFDGVYLDIIDAFEYFGPDGPHPERPTAAADMAQFVEAIANYARVTRGKSNFIVVPQNGSDLVRVLNPTNLAAYFAAIDAIGAEDTFFYGSQAINNAWRPQTWTIENLDQFLANGKPVLSIDYVTAPAKVKRFYQTAIGKGYVPYASVRALDRVRINPGFAPK